MPDCLFCRIVAGEVPATVVAETDRTLAFRDVSPQAPTHVLVVPHDHHADAGACADADPALLAEVMAAAVAVAERLAVPRVSDADDEQGPDEGADEGAGVVEPRGGPHDGPGVDCSGGEPER